jgi:iron-sulfur cluster insertion protein
VSEELSSTSNASESLNFQPTATNESQNFLVSDSAAKRIAFLLSDEPEGTKFRVAVNGGGCAGFQYLFDLLQDYNSEEDILIEKLGASIMVDKISLEYLKDSELNYVETLGSANFEIKNPNASSKCGCGNSFSV